MKLPLFSKAIRQQHPFHMVTPSPWPLLTSLSLLALMLSVIVYLHIRNENGFIKILISLCCLIFCISRWASDIIVEATFEGKHTQKVQRGLRQGMALFIVSEVMFFSGFFWAFFHSSLIPSIFIGGVWPPLGIEVLNPWGLPFLNTLILLSSGVSITWAHRNILAGRHWDTVVSLGITITFGIIFTLCQLKEYIEAPFAINSGIYGSIFFMATGFHGFHVMMGTILLIICFFVNYVFILRVNIMSVLKLQHDIDILLMLFGYFYLLQFIDEVHKK